MPIDACLERDGARWLYAGISPTRPKANGKGPSQQTLRSRLRRHFDGNAEGSTLRLSLGCLLSDTLGITLRRTGSGSSLTFGAGEATLSKWMAEHAVVSWLVHPEPWSIEGQLIKEISLPLNIQGNGDHPFVPHLRHIRSRARDGAKSLPVAGRAPRIGDPPMRDGGVLAPGQ
jgi:hypothetical protein